jgi:hypothetical protein
MPGGFAPRFAIEAAFLIAVGIGAGIADLRPVVIVALLAACWLLVSLIELAFWRAQRRPPLPLLQYVPPPVVPAEPVAEQADVVEAPDEDDAYDAYPLRAEAGSPQSEEVEAYTRVLGSDAQAELPEEASRQA